MEDFKFHMNNTWDKEDKLDTMKKGATVVNYENFVRPSIIYSKPYKLKH